MSVLKNNCFLFSSSTDCIYSLFIRLRYTKLWLVLFLIFLCSLRRSIESFLNIFHAHIMISFIRPELEKMGELGKLLCFGLMDILCYSTSVYQHVSITEFLNLQLVDTCFAQRNAFFQVDNTPLWQNRINNIMNWSEHCFERSIIPVFPGNTRISLCERCTWSVVVCYHFSGWNQFYVVENWVQTGLKMEITVLDCSLHGWNNECSFIFIVCSKDFHQHRMDFQLKIELKWIIGMLIAYLNIYTPGFNNCQRNA